MHPDEPDGPPSGANIIPTHCSPIRFLTATAGGDPYVSFPSMEAALADARAVLVMEADYGGQILLTCPMALVKCSHAILNLLLGDLAHITWGGRFDPVHPSEPSDGAGMYFEALRPGDGVAGGCGGGEVTSQLWLHPEVEVELQLRQQIERVIAGQQPRLELRPGFPNTPLGSLLEARSYPRGRVVLVSGFRNWPLVDCAASIVQVSEQRLLDLVGELDAWIVRQRRTNAYPPPGSGRVEFQVRPSSPEPTLDENFIKVHPAVLDRIRPEIRAVLNGSQTSFDTAS